MRRPVFIAGAVLWFFALLGAFWLSARGPAAGPNAIPEPSPEAALAEDVQTETIVEMTVPEDWQPPLVDGFTLVDQTGEEVTAESLKGTPYVAGFIFTRCQTHCPDLVGAMGKLRDRLKDTDARLLTVTVDPEFDTPERMTQYASIWVDDDDNWKFLTGDPDQLLALIRHGYRIPPSESELNPEDHLGPQAAHSLRLTHVDAEGRLAGSYGFRDEGDLVRLRKVLQGKADTAEENQPRPPTNLLVPVVTHEAQISVEEPADEADPPSDPLAGLPDWARKLPAVNASLNSLATLLLLGGFLAIKQKKAHLHRNLMVTCVAVSAAFLGCYLVYHWALGAYTDSHGKPFPGSGGAASLYYAILISHVVLAAAVPFLVVVSVWRAYKKRWEAHKRIVRWTFPIWLYVSVTGVVIYGMLYHWPA